MYLPPEEEVIGIALYQDNQTITPTLAPTTYATTEETVTKLDGPTTTPSPHDHDASYDSTKLLIIFMAIVFAVLLLFILIYYYCVKGMKSSTIARQAQKSTSGSITDEKARNIFAHPERHLAVDQSQRTSPSPSSVEDTSQVNAQANNPQQPQHQQQTGSQATGSSMPSTTITGGVSPQLTGAGAATNATAAANPATGGGGASDRSGLGAGSGAPGDSIHSRTPSTNTMTESQVAAAAATLSTSESMGGSQAQKSGNNQHSGGRKSTVGGAGQLARSPVKSKMNGPGASKVPPTAAAHQQHAGAVRKSPQRVADAGGRGNSVSAKTASGSSGSSNNSMSAAIAAAAKKSKTKSGSGKMTIVGTLANLRDTLKDTKIGAHH